MRFVCSHHHNDGFPLGFSSRDYEGKCNTCEPERLCGVCGVCVCGVCGVVWCGVVLCGVCVCVWGGEGGVVDSFLRGFWWRFHRCSSWTRLSCPLCAMTYASVQLLTVEVPQVQLIIEVIYIPFAAQSLVPMVHTVYRP